jgi:ParB family chromosome partitioning protein
MIKKRGLGKSLEALLAYNKDALPLPFDADDISTETLAATPSSPVVTLLPVSQLERGKYQPRQEMDPDSLAELAQSIRAQGILQPLIVRPLSSQAGRYEIVAGERRFRAAQLAGLNTVPALIRHLPDEAAMAIALIENIQREDLNPIETGEALQRLIHELQLTHQQVADAVGKSRASITNLLRLLVLPDTIKQMLLRRELEMGHARALLGLPEPVQLELAQRIIKQHLSVRETEQLVQAQHNAASTPSVESINADMARLAERLTNLLKLKVYIQHHPKGRGRLIIQYRTLDELDGLLTQLRETAASVE